MTGLSWLGRYARPVKVPRPPNIVARFMREDEDPFLTEVWLDYVEVYSGPPAPLPAARWTADEWRDGLLMGGWFV